VSSRLAPIGLLLAATAAALVYQAWHLGMTADEPSHFAAAYQYWLGNDVLRPSDTPPLTRIISGWVPCLLDAPVPRDTDGWRRRDAYQIGAETFGHFDAAPARRLLFLTRLPFLIFPLGVVFLVWHWGRALFGPWVAVMLAASAALEPTILGHGAIVKSDVAATFGALLFAWCAWRYWQAPALRRLPAVLLALVVAVLAKFTLLPLAVFAFILVLARGPRWAALLVPLTVYFAILAAYQFRAAPVEGQDLKDLLYAGVPARLFALASATARIPWPKQFVRGLVYIGGSLHGQGFSGYMLAGRSPASNPCTSRWLGPSSFPFPCRF
jgi:4-amino-4-deoxy-L-arabinose transferase-like glycosyltransferase